MVWYWQFGFLPHLWIQENMNILRVEQEWHYPVPLFCNLMGIRHFYIQSCPAFYIKIAFFILVVYTLVSPFILAVLILPCKGKAYGRIPSIVSLSVIWFYRQPSTNQRFGYSSKIITAYLAYHPFTLLFSACKIHSRQWS